MDITNSQELPGATLELKDVDNPNNVRTWVSTNTPHYLYLENGDYILCETIAPEGYALNTECVEFSVTGDKIVSVLMKNEPNVEIPNTNQFVSKILYIIGISFTLIGIIVSFAVLKKRKEKLQSI